MLCDDCKNREATYHEVREINGYRTDVHLCEQCRRKKGYRSDMSLFDTFLGSMGSFGALSGLFDEPVRKSEVCSKCGTTLDDFYSTGLLGCEDCYNEFGNFLLPRLRQTQAKISHEGKAPGKKVSTKNPEYAKLKKELAEAVDKEEYDKAAEIQEKIKKMEKEGNV